VKIKFYGNAFLKVELDSGQSVVCDPWILDGAYYGSWFHYPPIVVTEEIYNETEFIYISHLHPDHFDAQSLKLFDRSIPVIIARRSNPALLNALVGLGFENIYQLEVGKFHSFDGFEFRVWKDFVGESVSRHDSLNFELDSSLAIVGDDQLILNLNDNVIEPKSAFDLKSEIPTITCALIPYAGGGAYPQLFTNLSRAEKLAAKESLKRRFLENFLEVAKILNPIVTIPVAGEYVIGGKNWEYTEFLHTPTPTEIIDAWRATEIDSTLRIMSCGEVINLTIDKQVFETQEIIPTRSYSHLDKLRFAESKSSCNYVIDEYRIPTILRLPPSKVLQHLNKARVNLSVAQARQDIFPKSTLTIQVTNLGVFRCDLSEIDSEFVEVPNDKFDSSPIDLRVGLSYEYLYALLTGHVHWNNLEIGNHISLRRTPEKYDPDLHLMLSFFHL
jgi:UDP-MurNAc hydroxylase